MSLSSRPEASATSRSLLTVTSKRLEDESVLVTAVGEIDISTSPLLRSALEVALRLPAPAVVRVDLAGVVFLSSSGISVLLESRAWAEAAGTRLRLCGLNRMVRRTLELTGATEVLDIE